MHKLVRSQKNLTNLKQDDKEHEVEPRQEEAADVGVNGHHEQGRGSGQNNKVDEDEDSDILKMKNKPGFSLNRWFKLSNKIYHNETCSLKLSDNAERQKLRGKSNNCKTAKTLHEKNSTGGGGWTPLVCQVVPLVKIKS